MIFPYNYLMIKIKLVNFLMNFLSKNRLNIFFKKYFNEKHTLTFMLILIIIGGAFLRLYKLGESSYWIDEGFTLMQMRAIMQNGYPLLGSGEIDFKDFLLPYLLAPIDYYADIDSPFFFRFIPAIFGILSVYVLYLLGRKLFNQKIGLISSFFLAFSYWHIAWSRQTRGYSLLVFFLMLSVLLITLFERNHKKKYLLMALATIFLATFSKTLGLLIFIPFIFYLFIKKLNREALSVILIFSFLAWTFQQYFVSAFDLSFVNYLGFYSIDYLWKYFGTLLPLSLASFYLISKKNKSVHLFNFLCFLIPLIYFSFFCYISERRYLFFITPFIFLYGALVLNYISQSSKKKLFILVLLIIFIDYFGSQAFVFKIKSFYPLEDYTPQPNFISAYNKINADKKQNYYIISAYPYIDLLYLGKSDYYLPISYTGRENDNIKKTREHYSGTNRLVNEQKLDQLREKGDIYFVLDEMAAERVEKKMQRYVKKNSELLLEDNSHQQILVYKIPQKSE